MLQHQKQSVQDLVKQLILEELNLEREAQEEYYQEEVDNESRN